MGGGPPHWRIPSGGQADAKRPSSERSQGLKPRGQHRLRSEPNSALGSGGSLPPGGAGPRRPSARSRGCGGRSPRTGTRRVCGPARPWPPARPGLVPASGPGKPPPAPCGSGGGCSIGGQLHARAWTEGPVSASAPGTRRHSLGEGRRPAAQQQPADSPAPASCGAGPGQRQGGRRGGSTGCRPDQRSVPRAQPSRFAEENARADRQKRVLTERARGADEHAGRLRDTRPLSRALAAV